MPDVSQLTSNVLGLSIKSPLDDEPYALENYTVIGTDDVSLNS
jgi:hypothetical protein